jgi:hypothetical protein
VHQVQAHSDDVAQALFSRHGARPWRMTAADYAAGVRADADYVALSGPSQPTPWDPALAEAMSATGRAVYEEAVTDALIADLSSKTL